MSGESDLCFISCNSDYLISKRANKAWLVKKSMPEDSADLTALLEAAEAAAVARAV